MATQIGYKNLLTDPLATVTATTEATGFEVENVYDNFGYDWWKPTGFYSYVDIDFADTDSRTADYVAYWGHDLGTHNCKILVQYWNGSIYVSAFTSIITESNDTIYIPFTSVSATKWRVFALTAQNLLFWSEDFLVSPWLQTLYNGGAIDAWTVTSNQFVAPDNTLTAEKFVATATPGVILARQTGLSFTGAHRPSIYVYIPSGQSVTDVDIYCDFQDVESTNTQVVSTFDAWVRIDTLTATAAAARTFLDFNIQPDGTTPVAGFTFYLWGASMTSGTVALGYQMTGATSNTSLPSIAGIQLGDRMEMPHSAEIGFAPPTIAPKIVNKTAMSEGGTFIGGSRISEGIEGSLNFTNISPAFIRSDWKPFIDHIQTPKPFVVSWDTVTYTEETFLAWVDGDVDSPNYSSSLYMDMSVKFKGIK